MTKFIPVLLLKTI